MKLLLILYLLAPIQEGDYIYSQKIMYDAGTLKVVSGIINIYQNRVVFQPKNVSKDGYFEMPISQITEIHIKKIPFNRFVIKTKEKKHIFSTYKRQKLYDILDSLITKE